MKEWVLRDAGAKCEQWFFFWRYVLLGRVCVLRYWRRDKLVRRSHFEGCATRLCGIGRGCTSLVHVHCHDRFCVLLVYF
jgi:hypothetical protein